MEWLGIDRKVRDRVWRGIPPSCTSCLRLPNWSSPRGGFSPWQPRRS